MKIFSYARSLEGPFYIRIADGFFKQASDGSDDYYVPTCDEHGSINDMFCLINRWDTKRLIKLLQEHPGESDLVMRVTNIMERMGDFGFGYRRREFKVHKIMTSTYALEQLIFSPAVTELMGEPKLSDDDRILLDYPQLR